MCLSIVEKNNKDIFIKAYFFYYDDQKHTYIKEKAIENYEKFINSKHF